MEAPVVSCNVIELRVSVVSISFLNKITAHCLSVPWQFFVEWFAYRAIQVL